jgi:hypothetical protein
MSTFGDGTPQQELYEHLRASKRAHSLSYSQLLAIVLEVLHHITLHWEQFWRDF